MIAIGLLFIRMLCDCFKSRPQLEVEIMVLRYQLNVLQQRAPRRAHLRWADRALFTWLYRRCPRIRRHNHRQGADPRFARKGRAMQTSDRAIRRHCLISDPWRATSSLCTNLTFRKRHIDHLVPLPHQQIARAMLHQLTPAAQPISPVQNAWPG